MRKNKLLALGLAALMAASVAGCSTPSASVDDTKAAESGSDSSQSAAAGEKISVIPTRRISRRLTLIRQTP